MSLPSNFYSKQRGMSALGMLFFLLVLMFCSVAVVKLGPHYLESYTVNSAITKAVKNRDFDGLTSGKIKKKLSKFFTLNQIEGITAADIDISRDKGLIIIDATYERRVQFMANIDVVLKFDDLVYELQ